MPQTNVGIAVQVTSDTRKGTKGLKEFSDELSAMSEQSQATAATVDNSLQSVGNSAREASGNFVKLNKDFLSFSNTMRALPTAARLGKVSLNDTSGEAVALGKSIQRLSDEQRKLSNTSVGANGALIGFSNIVRDAPYGVIGVTNNITQFSDAFINLRTQLGSTGAALTALGSTLIGPAGISLGISIATSLWTVYAQRQQAAASAAKKAKEENKDLATVLRESNASVQGQIQTTRALGDILADTNKSYEQRKSALNELNKISKDYFSGLSVEQASYEGIKIAIDRYADSIIRAASIKGLQDRISQLAEQISKRVPIIAKGITDLGKSNEPFKQFVDRAVSDSNRAAKEINFKSLANQINASGKRVAADIGNVGRISRQAVDAIAPEQELRAKLKGFTDALTEMIGGTDTPDKAAKSIKTIADVMKDLNNELTGISIKAVDGLGFFDQTNAERIKAYEKALQGLIDLGLKPTSTEVEQLRIRIEQLNNSIIGEQTIKTSALFVRDKKGFKDTQSQANQIDRSIQHADESWNKFRANVASTRLTLSTENFRNAVQEFENLTVQLTKSLQVDLIAGFATGLAGLASGTQTMGGLLGSMLSIVGDFAINLGKAAIPIGIAAEAIRNAFASPAGAIAAGVGLIAIGGLIKGFASRLQGGIQSFATGGVVEGAQLAVVGDNPGKKEAIIPSEMWGELGGGRREILVTEVGYNALLIKLKQSERNSSR